MNALAGLLFCLATWQEPPAEPPPDVLTLKGGKNVEGIVLRQSEDLLWLGQGTRVRTVKTEHIEEMRGPRIAYREYIAKLRDAFRGTPTSAAPCIELAKWCREQGLTRDVDLHYWRALMIEPNNTEANEALGHKKIQGRWRYRVKGHGYVTWSELKEIRFDFTTPWILTTSHYHIKAATTLMDALNACAELELLYSIYFDTFQEMIGFYELKEPMVAHLYQTRDAYPSIANTLDGYFDPAVRVFYTYFRDGHAERLMQIGTRSLLHATARELSRNEPAMPGWIKEGIGYYMDSCFSGGPGSKKFEPGLMNQTFFATHANARKPDGLTRVLNYRTSDFSASTKQDLKFAQSYTLVYYLMHSDNEERREGFKRFLISCYERKGSMSHFKNAIDVRSLKTVEKEWNDYVKTAGSS